MPYMPVIDDEVEAEMRKLRAERSKRASVGTMATRALALAGLLAGSWALVVGFATVMISAVRVAGLIVGAVLP